MTTPPTHRGGSVDPLEDLEIEDLLIIARKARALIEQTWAGLPIDGYLENLEEELGTAGAWPNWKEASGG